MVWAVVGLVVWGWAGGWFKGVGFAGIPANLRLDPRTFDNALPAMLAQLSGHVLCLLATVLFVALAVGIGRKVGRWLGRSSGLADDGTALRFLLGFGAFAGVAAGLGFAGLLNRPVMWTFAAAGLASCAGPGIRSLVAAVRQAERPLLVSAVLAGIVLLPAALAPELETDSLTYHLPLPAIYLAEHRLRFVPHLYNNWFGHAWEVALVLPLSLGLDSFGRSLNMLLVLACGATIAGTVRRAVPAAPAWLALPLFVASFAMAGLQVHYVIGSSKSDLLALLIAFVAFSRFLPAWRAGRISAGGWLLLGLLDGAAWAVKPTVWPFVAGLWLILLVRCPGRLRGFGLLCAGSMLATGHWLAWAGLAGGNPAFPLFARFSPPPGFTGESVGVLSYLAGQGRLGTAWSAAGQGLANIAAFSPFVAAAFVPVLLGILRGSGTARACGAAVVVFFPAWVWGMAAVDRMGFPLAAPLLVAALSVVSGRWNARGGYRAFMGTVAAFSMAWGVMGTVNRAWAGAPLGHFLGLESRTGYCWRTLGVYGEAFRRLGREGTGRTLVIGEYRSWPFASPATACSGFGPVAPALWRLTGGSADPGRLAVRLKQERISRILYNGPGAVYNTPQASLFPWTARSVGVMRGFMAVRTVPVWVSSMYQGAYGFYILYEVTPARAPRPVWFIPGTEGEFGRLSDAVWGKMKPGEVDRELARLAPVFGGTGAFESRRGAALFLRSPGGACGAAADRWWEAGLNRGPELDALVRAFRCRVARGPDAANAAAFRRFVCGSVSSILPVEVSFSLIEGYPLCIPAR